MNTALKIAAFATAVAATFGTAYGVGQSIAPVTNEPPAVRHEEHDGDRRKGENKKEKPADHTRHTATAPGDLRIPDRGYALDLNDVSV
ncbi:hypothetical protein ACFYO9_38505 [Streptomyces sp. NPDC005863]|uniref:hypothetical protein n=1 Tax=unclassified Streptomyces TaxID=2593676 RepID=UPI0033D90D79